ncbi:MAG: ATP-binding cassette domain-containing protein [Pseudomonadota bacterium]
MVAPTGPTATAQPANTNPILTARGIKVRFGQVEVLKGADLDVYPGEILGFVGGSGSGKSVLMRTLLNLIPRQSGQVDLFGINYAKADEKTRISIDRRMGVLFQHGALFSSLTVRENIQVPMREYYNLSPSLMDELADVKLELVGLPLSAADKAPSELSGGMIKRAALARALALDPELVFLDEPTSGLDPIGAAEFDRLLRSLRDSLGLTVYMVTHDLDSITSVCDRVAVLRQGRVLANGTLTEVMALDDPWVRSYFHGERARAARSALPRGFETTPNRQSGQAPAFDGSVAAPSVVMPQREG